MKTAIVYDRVNKWGGAEKVLLAIHELFPDAPLYTAVYSPDRASWASVFQSVIPSFLQKIPILRENHELLGALTPLAFESLDFDKFNLVISVTSEAAKGIITKPHTKHICYCLTPTRYLWSGYDEYLNNPPKKLRWIPFYKVLSKPFLSYTKSWDKIAAQRPDSYIAISTDVQKRIKKYYGRESSIIFPPVDMDKIIGKTKHKYAHNKYSYNYYLIVSRLVPYKKVDLAIKAFNKTGDKLVIIGKGSEEGRLKSIAKNNIEFKGFVDESELLKYYSNAKAFIYPQEEDFGITAVEAQAAGVPVLAYKSGGVLDTVIDGMTGLFFEEQKVESLMDCIHKFKKTKFKVKDMQENALRFSNNKFKRELGKLIDSL